MSEDSMLEFVVQRNTHRNTAIERSLENGDKDHNLQVSGRTNSETLAQAEAALRQAMDDLVSTRDNLEQQGDPADAEMGGILEQAVTELEIKLAAVTSKQARS